MKLKNSFQMIDILGERAYNIGTRIGGDYMLDASVARNGSTSNADRWICDFYDTAGGRRRGSTLELAAVMLRQVWYI